MNAIIGRCDQHWPIDEQAGSRPAYWKGWPDGKKFAFILTHDVDTVKGQSRCLDLMRMEQKAGFRSSFNFVPERYPVSMDIMKTLRGSGFEIGVHDLMHDGKLFKSRDEFLRKSKKINQYLEMWQCVGFRSGAMLYNLEWISELNIRYDSSTFDTDPFEPQPEGLGTIFPIRYKGMNGNGPYIEMPYTMPQDFTLFVLMKERNSGIWRRKLDWIADKGGMVLMNAHPDYMQFDEGKIGFDEYPAEYYGEFLELVRKNYQGQYWHVLPGELAGYIEEMCGEPDGEHGEK